MNQGLASNRSGAEAVAKRSSWLGALVFTSTVLVAAQAQQAPAAAAASSAGGAPSVGAPPADQAPGQNAELERGLTLYQAGEYARAADVWERLANQLGPDRGYKLFYNLGLAYHAMGDATRAVQRFRDFLVAVAAREAALPPGFEQRRQDAAARIKEIESSHAAVSLPATEGTVVRIDGGPPRVSGFVAYLKPGVHEVQLIRGAEPARRRVLTVVAGQSLAIDTQPPPAPPQPPRPPPPPPRVVVERVAEPPSFPTAWVLVGAGLTAASFVLPAVLWHQAADERAAAEQLDAGHSAYAEALGRYQDARTAYQVSYLLPAALGAATAAVAVVGAVRVWTAHQSAPPGGPRLSLGIRSGGALLWVSGSL